MDKQEEILLMTALLMDVSFNPFDEIIPRLWEANCIAKKYNFDAIEKSTREVIEQKRAGNLATFDENPFRIEVETGGFIGLSKFYGGILNFNWKYRSEEFRKKANELMTSQRLMFPDFTSTERVEG
ncbi:hypothetical protein BV582_21460 [Bacillus paralicheniformis]|uniref:hypothetical protein n=1 Tax=Bacillus paralicheniformis TaxID=1648923 RepID=UPI000C768D63|nr:hypothetical protein [Bacillus paralicheniformis]PLC14140.1 hypothetical protein BV582_21460 [Bacillus paralicheniformis]